ncbi:restriction endonuclease subunit S [Hymenobacter caeli]|uniref:Type I restriction enzyme S subunit n=1 Tax=Hymenobacter caeli TaxID=2735894 RepID=A0ABX2FM40_9BACT|nr:restriction endonuclease subunit S [Hymenobacter caeli]NRT17537.1 type I restriction enzyme S subunit [Hymenobacter caeli]
MDTTQVPAGYKLTDLGVLPEEWEVKTLGEIAFIGSGGTPNRKMLEYWDGTIPWVTTAQINSNIIEKAEEFITDAGLQNSAAKMFKKGALLMAMYGQGKTRGKVAVLGIDATTNQACAVIELKDNAQSNYIFYNLTARYEELRQLSNSGGQENLSGGIIKRLSVALPPLAEQQAIAEALGEMDALLAAQRARLAKQRAVKQGLLQGLLSGQQRLPGFAGEWEVKTLSQVATIGIGRTPSRSVKSFWGRGYPWISIADLQTKFIDSTKEEITEAGAASGMTIIPAGTLVMSFKLSLGRMAILQRPMYSNEAICSLQNLSADRDYLHYVLGRTDFSLYGKQAVKGFTLNKQSLAQIEIPFPSPEEQRAIAAVLSEADAYLAALEAEHAKTQLLKQGMMQNLLTGKLRLV